MSTDTTTVDAQPPATAASRKRLSTKTWRMVSMTRQLLDEVYDHPLDSDGFNRLRAVDTLISRELLDGLPPDLCEELHRLALPLTSHADLSDAELRVAHAQLVGWLEGLLETLQSGALIPAVHTNVETGNNALTTCVNDNVIGTDEPPVRAARQILIEAITTRIAQNRLTAAQAASVLQLTGRQVTQLLRGHTDEFSIEALLALLPALNLRIQIVSDPVANAP